MQRWDLIPGDSLSLCISLKCAPPPVPIPSCRPERHFALNPKPQTPNPNPQALNRNPSKQGGELIFASIAAQLSLDASRMKLIHKGKVTDYSQVDVEGGAVVHRVSSSLLGPADPSF